MNIFAQLKNLFRKGGAKLGMVNSLVNITDDPRISIPASEYSRIRLAKTYYKDDLKPIRYKNSLGVMKERPISSINITKMSAHRLASIIFNEQCTVNIQNEQADALLDEVIKDNDFYNRYEEHLENGIALGGFAIRPYIENDKVKLAYINADQFYPLHTNQDEVDAAAVASTITKTESDRTIYYTLLEFHEWDGEAYKITNELYRSESPSQVGINVPLSTLAEYENLAPSVELNGLTKPLFAYFKAPGANNKRLDSPLGLGIVDNAKSIVDAINMTHDQFVWEVKNGRRKIAVPAEMIKPGARFGNEQDVDNQRKPMLDDETDVYLQLFGDTERLSIQDLTSSIRNTEYQQTMDFFLSEFENAIGLSQGTFTNMPSGVKTATEVVTNNSMTYQTRSSYLTQVEKQLKNLVVAIFELMSCGQLYTDGQARFTGNVEELDIVVDFADGVFTDKTTQFTQDSQAVTMGVMPKKRFLMRNFNLDEQQADQWLEELEAEQPENNINSLLENNDYPGNGDD